MNFLAHHEVARRSLGYHVDRAVLFGAMAPDLVGMFRMARSYKTNDLVDRPVAEGIRLHYATNAIFDELDVIKSLEAALTTSFKTFMPRWPAVQSARVGKDMLFDGFLRGNDRAVDSYQCTMIAAASGKVALHGVTKSPERFAMSITALWEAGLPRYDNPTVVATRLQQRLHGTPTQFDPSLVPQLALAMAEQQPTINEIGAEVMDAVVEGVRAA